jgi:1,4-alpha-glucan branching enzyme
MPGSIENKFSNLRAFNMYMFAHPGKKLSFMSSEFGQFKEWNYSEGVEFFMLKYPLHKKLHEFNKQLNYIYKSTPAMFEIEDSWQGFNWITADERENNVLSFERIDKKGNKLVCIFNFSGNDYYNYRLGVEKGEYRLVLNSDSKKHGGRGVLKGRTFKTVKKQAHAKENSIRFNLPALSGIYFIKL